MKIGELAQRSGLSASRIRFYESAGLLHTVERSANGYRDYAAETLTVLEIITGAQKAGFSLDEIRSLMPSATSALEPDKLLAALAQKVADIEALEKRLAHNRAHLLALMDGIRNRPEGLDCAGNAQRLLGRIRNGSLPVAV